MTISNKLNKLLYPYKTYLSLKHSLQRACSILVLQSSHGQIPIGLVLFFPSCMHSVVFFSKTRLTSIISNGFLNDPNLVT